jgi:hypothetical protein
MKGKSAIILLPILGATGASHAATLLTGSSEDWRAIPGDYDAVNDHQTGQGADDIVGTADDPGFFTGFIPGESGGPTDGDLAFRVRLSQAGDNQTPPGFGGVLWVGIDATLDGSLDVFLSASDKPNPNALEVWAPGNDLNNSPSTTSIAKNPGFSTPISTSNFNYRAVDLALDGGTTHDLGLNGVDFYLSFALPFAAIAEFLQTESGISVTNESPLRYVLATSTQTSSFNQDLGGIDGNDPDFNPDLTWEELGGLSVESTVVAGPVPEPRVLLLAFASTGLLVIRRRHGDSAA